MGKKLFKIVTLFIFVIALVLLGMNAYFKLIFPMNKKLTNNVQLQIKNRHIHPLTYSHIPDIYRKAVIATEDQRFNWDPGIDPLGIGRSLLVDMKQGKYVQGGSTITQQLVDNTFIQRNKSLKYKLLQTLYAIGIYDTVSKSKTFEMYVNVIYFGHGAYGLYNAAETYFGKVPSQLNDGQLTLLAGLPNAPSIYDPFKNIKLARRRQRVVVNNMVDTHVISKSQADHILKEAIQLKKRH